MTVLPPPVGNANSTRRYVANSVRISSTASSWYGRRTIGSGAVMLLSTPVAQASESVAGLTPANAVLLYIHVDLPLERPHKTLAGASGRFRLWGYTSPAFIR